MAPSVQPWLLNASTSGGSEAGWHAPGVFVSTWSSEAESSPHRNAAASKGEPTTPVNFFPRSPANSLAPQSHTSTHRHALCIYCMCEQKSA